MLRGHRAYRAAHTDQLQQRWQLEQTKLRISCGICDLGNSTTLITNNIRITQQNLLLGTFQDQLVVHSATVHELIMGALLDQLTAHDN